MTLKKVAYLLCGFSVAALLPQASADMVNISCAKIVRAKKENPQQKIAADELEKHLKLIDDDIINSSVKALISAVNRYGKIIDEA